MKIEDMADIFLNSTNFAKHTFSTLAPPRGYALNLKALIKVFGLLWAVGAAEKKKLDYHKYATFEVSFFMFSWAVYFFSKCCSIRTKTLQVIFFQILEVFYFGLK